MRTRLIVEEEIADTIADLADMPASIETARAEVAYAQEVLDSALAESRSLEQLLIRLRAELAKM